MYSFLVKPEVEAPLERFSIECRKQLASNFGFALLHSVIGSKLLRHYFNQPDLSETKTNRGSLVYIFPHFLSATCNYFQFWLVYWIVYVLFDWPK